MKDISEKNWKYWLFSIGLVLSFFILLASVLKLSLVQGKYYKELA
jgi:hypothetical protein